MVAKDKNPLVLTKKEIENDFIMNMKNEILYQHKLIVYMNAIFPQFVYEPPKLKDQKEAEGINTNDQSPIGS